MAKTFRDWLKDVTPPLIGSEVSLAEMAWHAAQAAQRERDAATVIRVGTDLYEGDTASIIAEAILADTGDEPCSPKNN
jgi:hypothetical protein